MKTFVPLFPVLLVSALMQLMVGCTTNNYYYSCSFAGMDKMPPATTMPATAATPAAPVPVVRTPAKVGTAKPALAAPLSVPTAPTDAKTLIVWDGETHAVGGGWADHKTTDRVEARQGEAHSGNTAVAFEVHGAEYHGFGWNWCGFDTSEASADVSAYQNMSFWMKITGSTKPSQIKIRLTSPGGAKASTTVDAMGYCPTLTDGQWHQVTIPMHDLQGEKNALDPHKVWEIDLATWNEHAVDCTFWLDDLGFMKN